MASGPAAAAVDGSRPETASLQARLRALVADPSDPCGARLASRLLPASSSEPGEARPSRPPYEGFYWLRMAAWLADAFDLRTTPGGDALFDDLCWVQYCVYGLFRVQDDLVDGDTDEALVAVEANRLLVEAARCAARLFDGSSRFWEIFGDKIEATSSALIVLDELQRQGDRTPHVELDLYAKLGASLQIAAAGVAVAAGRMEDWERRVSPAMDRLAVAGQILDDLEDLEEDLAAGRINYAAWSLAHPVFGASAEATLAVIASNVATTNRLEALLEVPRKLASEAAERVGRSLCPPMHAYLVRYRRGIDLFEERLRADRLRLLE